MGPVASLWAVLLVALAELGDKSQVLALMLAMRYRRPGVRTKHARNYYDSVDNNCR